MTHRLSKLLAATSLTLAVWSATAQGAELNVFTAAALNPVTSNLFREFERSTGHKLIIRSTTGPILSKEIQAGASFDVAILSLDVDGLIKQGLIAEGSRVPIVRTGVGVGVRQGSPKPDVSTVEAFKNALLKSDSVAYSRQGSSGLYFLKLLDRLGISAEMKDKLKPQDGVNPADAVAKGEAEMTVLGIALILLQPGADYVGDVPPELQSYVLFTGGVGAASKQKDAAQSLLRFLTTPSAQSAFKAKGFESISQ